MIKQLNEEIIKMLEEHTDENIINEYAWKLTDRNNLFVDTIIAKLQEMKEYGELSQLGSYMSGIADTVNSIDDIITDYNDDLGNLALYIDYESQEDIESVIGWLDSYLTKYDGILKQIGAIK